MGQSPSKAPVLSPQSDRAGQMTRRGENRRFGGCPSAPLPGAYAAYKNAGDRATKGLQPE